MFALIGTVAVLLVLGSLVWERALRELGRPRPLLDGSVVIDLTEPRSVDERHR